MGSSRLVSAEVIQEKASVPDRDHRGEAVIEPFTNGTNATPAPRKRHPQNNVALDSPVFVRAIIPPETHQRRQVGQPWRSPHRVPRPGRSVRPVCCNTDTNRPSLHARPVFLSFRCWRNGTRGVGGCWGWCRLPGARMALARALLLAWCWGLVSGFLIVPRANVAYRPHARRATAVYSSVTEKEAPAAPSVEASQDNEVSGREPEPLD